MRSPKGGLAGRSEPAITGEPYPLGAALDLLAHFWMVNHEVERVSSRMERAVGISAAHRLVLRCIGKFPDITPGQIARVLHLDPGTISATLRRLDNRALVERRKDPRDHRRACLGLTPAGRVLDRPMSRSIEHAVERLLRACAPGEIAATKRVLQRLSHILRDESKTPRAAPRLRDAAPTAEGS